MDDPHTTIDIEARPADRRNAAPPEERSSVRPAVLGSLCLILAAGLACGDSGGPDLDGPVFFTGTLDGSAWAGDTVVATLTSSTALSITGARVASADEEQEITLFLSGFGQTGTFVLAGGPTAGVAALSVLKIGNNTVTAISTYLSSAAAPGELRITGISTKDSVVTGSFLFEAAAVPDTAPHRHVSGRFRVRYRTLVVYPPGCPECRALTPATRPRRVFPLGGGVD
jgi:hypothetical protein